MLSALVIKRCIVFNHFREFSEIEPEIKNLATYNYT